jgi:hypothetical protein
MDSTHVTLRIPTILIEKIDAQGKRSAVINQILANHFSSDPVWARPPIPKHEVIEAAAKPKPPMIVHPPRAPRDALVAPYYVPAKYRKGEK